MLNTHQSNNHTARIAQVLDTMLEHTATTVDRGRAILLSKELKHSSVHDDVLDAALALARELNEVELIDDLLIIKASIHLG